MNPDMKRRDTVLGKERSHKKRRMTKRRKVIDGIVREKQFPCSRDLSLRKGKTGQGGEKNGGRSAGT